MGNPSLAPHIASITIYTPEAKIALKSDLAKKQFTNYEISEEDKRATLTVDAHGSVGTTVAEGCTSITRVVLLSDSQGKVVIEPVVSEPITEVWRNGYGATSQCIDLRSEFTLEEVRKVREAAPSNEFLVAVFSGSVLTKTYKVKKKHQVKLGLN